jgi:hypothetical protein
MVSASGSLSFQAGVFATSLLIGDRVAPDSSSPEGLSVRYGVDALSARVYFVELAGTLSVNWTGRAAFHSAYRVVFTFIAPTGSPFRRTFTPSGPCPRRLGSIRNVSESCWRRQERCRSARATSRTETACSMPSGAPASPGRARRPLSRSAGPANTSNAPRVQRGMLYRAGLIAPRGSGRGSRVPTKFAPEDLDAFLDRLLDGAEPVEAAGAGQADSPDAAKQCCRSANTAIDRSERAAVRQQKIGTGSPGCPSDEPGGPPP